MKKKTDDKRALALLAFAALLSLASPAFAEELTPLPLKTDPLPVKDIGDTVAAPMVELPITPDQAEADKKVVLSGTAASGNFNLLGAAAVAVDPPLTRYEGPRLKFVEVTIRNNGTYPVVIIGEGSRGIGPGLNLSPLPIDTLLKLDNHILSKADKIALGAISVGSVGLAGPIAYEMLTAQDHSKRNLGTAVGRDAGRHEIEASRLNRRVILPQDETKGWLAFYDDSTKGMNSLLVPLTYPYNNSSGSVTIPISNPAATTSAKAKPVYNKAETAGALGGPQPVRATLPNI
ncbi:MAG: hypothetical protein C0508_20280 [Cyanobacteria bacterium PR.023]|nr:hypothetical protein [Cyanobacteria bacterium PR.023]MDQ5932951.1 hypothetical protein [Cyanobacteriota bacterium erpe_2018_sw_21hr_WHONDRS-SW48-000092_B_bin.40]